jgi:hypothetical protein
VNSALSGTVNGILSGWAVNIAAADGSNHVNVPIPQWYAPQIGDVVVVGFYGGGQPYMAALITQAARLVQQVIPKIPTITVRSSAPGAGYSAIASTYATSGSAAPDLVLVPTAYVPPPAAPSVLNFAPVGSDSYDSYFSGWRGDSNVYQGGGGNAYGLYFYGSVFTGPLASVTPSGITMTVSRDSGVNGSDGPVPVHVWLHAYPSKPGGVPLLVSGYVGPALAKGQTATFALPLSFATALKAGTAFGVGLYASGSDYLHALSAGDPSGSGLITITA